MSLYTKLLWLQKYLQGTDFNFFPVINDIDFLILPFGEINIDDTVFLYIPSNCRYKM